jgi:hypothetical protein
MKLTGENRSTRRKTCPSATLSTTNPTWTDPGSNLGLRGEAGDWPPEPWHGQRVWIMERVFLTLEFLWLLGMRFGIHKNRIIPSKLLETGAHADIRFQLNCWYALWLAEGLLSTLRKKHCEIHVPSFVMWLQLNFYKTTRGICWYNIILKDLYVWGFLWNDF